MAKVYQKEREALGDTSDAEYAVKGN